MSKDFDLIAEIREDQGKGASRRLRHKGKVPAIIYGAGRPPRQLAFDHNRVLQQLENESFYSSILNIKVGDKSQAAIVKDIQRHPAKQLVMHMDFQRIVADVKIKMNVPIHYVNAEEAVGVRVGGGSVSQLITDVEVSCLPKDLPEFFEVDIVALELNEMLHISDIKVPDGVEIPQLAQGQGNDHAIVSIHVIKAVVEEEDVEVVVGEGEGEGEDAAAGEGDAPAADGDGGSDDSKPG
ncbi:MAG: 50S ribosomal protein L25/general stress protein Ctc [Woeseiaceae bacterium]|jgi:large subunit ribosomal protein L25|nr:50S ribosomal protein L25/general stress protein Ctc [Woeseiaceae bacterium]|tara:strand:- start:622 stop:1335 length:714 start_codon:yes stop_codon:yes gene_type:complete